MIHAFILGTEASAPWSYLGYVALVAAAFFTLFGARSNQSKKDLTVSVTALQGRLDAKQDEITDLNKEQEKQAALIKSQDQQIVDLRSSLHQLERVVTGVDAINALRDEVEKMSVMNVTAFEHLGVPSSKIMRANS